MKLKYKKYPMYNVSETGLGHWTDTEGDEANACIINIYEAVNILNKIGTDIEWTDTESIQDGDENDIENIDYYMIYDYTPQNQGIPGLYIPFNVYELYINIFNN